MKAILFRFLRKSWYWLLLLASTVAVGIVGFCYARRRIPGDVIEGDPGSDFPERLRRVQEERARLGFHLERVRLEGEIERARVTAGADTRRAELAEIERVGENDPVAARRALATWLTENL